MPYHNSTLDQILDMEALKREISEFSHVTYPSECAVPEDLKALVEMMLRPNPRDRPTTQQLLSHASVVRQLAALHRTMSYHESIVQHNVREVSTTQLARDPPRDQARDQLALSSDSISLSDSTSSLPRLITPPMTRRASDINARPVPQTPPTDAKNSAPKKDPGRTKFSNRFNRQNARASSYFKPNSFTNGIPNTGSGIPRSPRASAIPSSFMASPPPSLGSTPLPSYDDLFEYFKTNKMAPSIAVPTSAVSSGFKLTPVNSSLAPLWKQVANLILFLLRIYQGYFGCGDLASPARSHMLVLHVLAAVTLVLSVHKKQKIPQIVATCLLLLWTLAYYLTRNYCTPLIADLPAEQLTQPSLAVLAYATLCYALALVLLFADQQIERWFGWNVEPESKEQKTYAGGEVDWNALRQQLQQLKKRH